MPRVLVVEDEAPVLMLAESVLEQAGYDVVAAHTLAEALRIIRADNSVDLVFTDLALGSHAQGGFVIGELVGHEWPDRPVLYTSGLPARCTPFLPKPYTGEQLTDAVAILLRQGTAASGND